jgi:hypothetical protein
MKQTLLNPRHVLWAIAILMLLIGVWLTLVNNEHARAFDWAVALIFIAIGYASWRTARWFAIKAFKVLLIAVSQLGAAWSGQVQT